MLSNLAASLITHGRIQTTLTKAKALRPFIERVITKAKQAAAKTDKSRLLSAMIWLTDMSTFQEMNKVWEAWVVPGATPARATVMSAQLAASDFKIEIAVIAAQA